MNAPALTLLFPAALVLIALAWGVRLNRGNRLHQCVLVGSTGLLLLATVGVALLTGSRSDVRTFVDGGMLHRILWALSAAVVLIAALLRSIGTERALLGWADYLIALVLAAMIGAAVARLLYWYGWKYLIGDDWIPVILEGSAAAIAPYLIFRNWRIRRAHRRYVWRRLLSIQASHPELVIPPLHRDESRLPRLHAESRASLILNRAGAWLTRLMINPLGWLVLLACIMFAGAGALMPTAIYEELGAELPAVTLTFVRIRDILSWAAMWVVPLMYVFTAIWQPQACRALVRVRHVPWAPVGIVAILLLFGMVVISIFLPLFIIPSLIG